MASRWEKNKLIVLKSWYEKSSQNVFNRNLLYQFRPILYSSIADMHPGIEKKKITCHRWKYWVFKYDIHWSVVDKNCIRLKSKCVTYMIIFQNQQDMFSSQFFTLKKTYLQYQEKHEKSLQYEVLTLPDHMGSLPFFSWFLVSM